MLNNLKRNNRIKSKKRLGRGYGSGKGGHTVGRGQKGQKSRAGHKSLIMFEGGNVPFFRRMPKYRGQKNKVLNNEEFEVVNVSALDKAFKSGEIVNKQSLAEKKLIKKGSKLVKILGSGELTKKLTVQGIKLSSSAKEKVLASKGIIK